MEFIKEQLDTFVYWIKERHKVHTKRRQGHKPPWSKDKVMNGVFFTNPYRENDKATIWFRLNVREPLRGMDQIVFATILFRRFNSIPVGEILLRENLYVKWDSRRAYKAIRSATKDRGLPFTGGAYMMGAPEGSDKLVYFCKVMSLVHGKLDIQKNIVTSTSQEASLEEVHRIIKEIPYFGPFISYEIVTDLRHTHILDHASDIDTWCCFGPGAKRGLSRLLHGVPKGTVPNRMHIPYSMELLEIVRRRLKSMPHFELREIEHSLCEFDKYQRVAEGGRPKRWYHARIGKN